MLLSQSYLRLKTPLCALCHLEATYASVAVDWISP